VAGLPAKFAGCPSRDGALGVIGVSGKASLGVNNCYFTKVVVKNGNVENAKESLTIG
jgi:hypothetical protein